MDFSPSLAYLHSVKNYVIVTYTIVFLAVKFFNRCVFNIQLIYNQQRLSILLKSN